ncbi:MAG: SDR family NAD(P)-dependent oxidoreductase [Deltaproteobacteria bacterium]|nr:SDR family NAD(P)-dependent oxidoreductase [Deltaproteobacteria bacterium]NND30453.1 SDR family NAD(P)-dependent oxidoreductase [Myxococcales bacterium]MBT8463817.1 SDR family NAD(P)-dependent oxidoreductase [Deltaproteobacteria bacterium]MBT8481008.1 SDR family NAD(P)-dependent oxidoreductase [Deltaproteobacteria bacterium]NNK07360.1 SDR family NAD(P)-dependent oxidoreductase [Myxococcales bacterium]
MQLGGTSLVQGASRGIGLELVRQLLERQPGGRVIATCRRPDDAAELQELAAQHPGRLRAIALDVREETSIAAAAEAVAGETEQLELILNVAGILHGPGFGPEKKLAQVEPEPLRHAFEVNAFGPLLIAKHFHDFLRHRKRSVFASLSARVGSISDNRLGGWYAYRGSKAAQNMFTKNISIELARVAPHAIVVGLHPGTVDTGLSKPFQRNVPETQLLPPSKSVAALLRVIDSLEPDDSGKIFDFRGKEITP